MAEKFSLDSDEVIILKQENVWHGGIMAGYTDDLVLTNKALAIVKKGVFGNIKQIIRYPLENIKVYNEQAQAILGKANTNGAPQLEVYFINGQENFVFRSKRDIYVWVEKINELVTGNKTTTIDNNARMAIPGSAFIAKALKGTIDTYKDAFGIKKKIERISNACPTCGASVTGIRGQTIKCPYCDSYIDLQ